MKHRLAQIESTLKRAVAEVLSQHLSDPRVTGLVSVTRVTVSPDLHDAYVFISVLPAKYEKRTMMGLRHAVGHIHALVCRAVRMRTVPRLEFRLDESIKRQAEVDRAIHRAAARGGTVTAPEPAAESGDHGTGKIPEES